MPQVRHPQVFVDKDATLLNYSAKSTQNMVLETFNR